MTIHKTLPVSLCMMLSAAAFAADNTAPVIIDASSCLDIVSPIERLACFEEQANAAQRRSTSMPKQDLPVVSIPRNTRPQPAQSTPQATQQVQPQPALDAPQPAESASVNTTDSFEDNFGLPEEKINDSNEKANELIATVAELKELNGNRFIITLENGQVWEQMETRRFALAEGDEVRIYPTRWGSSYRLSSQSHNGFIQVQRLR